MSNTDVMNNINPNFEERKEEMNMKAEQLVEIMEAREILHRSLEEGQLFSGIVEFAQCIIHEGKPYLGNVTSFGVNDKNQFFIDVEIDKEPESLYTFTVPVKLFIGSELYFIFRELGIMNNRGEADLEKLDGKRVQVILKRDADGQFEIETITAQYVDVEETFTEEDFMQPDDGE